jgi:hypothetical protein
MAKYNWQRGVGTNTYTMHNVHTGARQLEKFSYVFFIIKTVFSATPIPALCMSMYKEFVIVIFRYQ